MNLPELEAEVIRLRVTMNLLITSFMKVDPDILKKIQEGTKSA